MTHIHNHALPFPGKDDEKYIQPMADIFKVLSDPTRIRILSLLAHEEMCVTCIADSLGMTHSAISASAACHQPGKIYQGWQRSYLFSG